MKTVAISKLVTSATENSLMPLVQLSLLIPLLAQFFLKEPEILITEDSVIFPSNWTFFVTIVSVMASLVTLGVSFTENYFAKPGRTTHKTKLRWIIFFLSIICQVVPKLFAYLHAENVTQNKRAQIRKIANFVVRGLILMKF